MAVLWRIGRLVGMVGWLVGWSVRLGSCTNTITISMSLPIYVGVSAHHCLFPNVAGGWYVGFLALGICNHGILDPRIWGKGGLKDGKRFSFSSPFPQIKQQAEM